MGISERGTVDPTRQGGETAPSQRAASHPAMSYAEARRFYDGMTWRTIRTRTHRAMQALVEEIERLRVSGGAMASLLRDQGCRNLDFVCEIERMVDAGLIPAPVRDDEPADDGA